MKKIPVLFAIAGIAILATWQLGSRKIEKSHLETKNTTPHSENAHKAIATSADSSNWAKRLVARGKTNNLGSATETFKDSRNCLLYYIALDQIASESNDERLNDLSNRTLESLEHIDATSSRYLSIVRQTEDLCAGSNREAVTQIYSDAILKAALLGDPDAESCFVISDPHIPGTENSAQLTEFLEDRYIKYAPIFTAKALQRADPYVAQDALYRYVASPSRHPSKLDDLPRADPYLTWQTARLASLRAMPEQRTVIENWLAKLEQQGALQPDAIKRANDWAKTTYARDFSNQPQINLDSQAPCYSSLNLIP